MAGTKAMVSHKVCLSEIDAPVYSLNSDNRELNLFGVFPLSWLKHMRSSDEAIGRFTLFLHH